MTDEETIDVQSIPPQQHHTLIFMAFERLATGEAFVIVNNHDPGPLRRQFENLHGGEFDWQYLEAGPAVWRVRMCRTGGGAR